MIWCFGELNVAMVDVGADAVVLLVASTGKSVPYDFVPVDRGLAAVDVDIGIMSGVYSKSVPYAVVVNVILDVEILIKSGVDSKSVPYAVVPVNIGLAAVDVDIGIMSGVDSKSVPYVVVVNVRLDVDILIKSGVDSKSVPYAVVPVNIELAAVDVDIGIMTGVDKSFVVVALKSEP